MILKWRYHQNIFGQKTVKFLGSKWWKYSELGMENDILSQGQKSLRINWATNDNHETTLSPGAKIYAKLIGLDNIELSEKI